MKHAYSSISFDKKDGNTYDVMLPSKSGGKRVIGRVIKTSSGWDAHADGGKRERHANRKNAAMWLLGLQEDRSTTVDDLRSMVINEALFQDAKQRVASGELVESDSGRLKAKQVLQMMQNDPEIRIYRENLSGTRPTGNKFIRKVSYDVTKRGSGAHRIIGSLTKQGFLSILPKLEVVANNHGVAQYALKAG